MTVTALVENVTPRGARIAFVLESPHVEEVREKHPLAGESGIEISKRLLNEETPFGYIAKCLESGKPIKTRVIRAFSVVNVSRVPMQREAYENNNLNVPRNIDQLERLRKLLQVGSSMATVHIETDINTLKWEVYKEFRSHAEMSLASHQLIVPCGNFSRVFCEALVRDSGIVKATLIAGVPHPSRHGWLKLNSEVRERIRGELL